MAQKTSGERERFWRGLIGKQRASGLSIGRFCEQARVAPNSFFVWKRRLQATGADVDATSALADRATKSTRRRPRSRKTATSLIPVRLVADRVPGQASGAAAIEVAWPSGVVLRIPLGCDGGTLRDLVGTLVPLIGGDGP